MLSNEEVVDRVKYYLDKQHMTAYRLCKKADISYSTIANLFTRGNSPSVFTLQKIVDGLGISMAEFFKETGECQLSDISPREETLVYQYRRLSKRDRELVQRMLNVMEKKKDQ